MKEKNNSSVHHELEENIKKENKKAGIRFIIIIICSAVLGAAGGMLTVMVREDLKSIGEIFETFMTEHMTAVAVAVPAGQIAIAAVAAVWCLHNIKSSKKNVWKLINEDNDEELRKIEKKLSYDMWLISGLMILHLLLFSFMFMIFADFDYEPDRIPWLPLYSVLSFIIGMGVVLVLQQKLVDCIKLISPEKKGSVYEIHFEKKWEESSDEAEKQINCKAAYRTYKVVTYLCIVLWMVLMFLEIATGTGFLPIIVVLIIWGVMLSVYSYYCIKYSNY